MTNEDQAVIAALLREALQRLPAGAQRGGVPAGLPAALRGVANEKWFAELERQVNTLPMGEKTPEMFDILGRLAMAAGSFEPASAWFQQAAERVGPSQAEAYYNSYRALLEQHQWDKALVALGHAARLDPECFALFPLEKYEPKRLLGAGVGGVTFLCHHLFLDRDLVIKALHHEGVAWDITDVRQVGHSLKRPHHPAIIGVSEADYAHSGRPYLVREHFEAVSLENYLAGSGPLTQEQALALAQPMAQALQTVHDQGVLHRNLKPGNLLVSPEEDSAWTVRLIDFGPAAYSQVMTAGTIGHSLAGVSLGNSYQFSAPEQWGLVAGTVGPWSDVYAFGKILCHALFQNTQPTLEEWADLGLNHPLVTLINRCIHTVPAKRPQTFLEVLTALEGVADQQAKGAMKKNAQKALEQGDRYHTGQGVARDDAEAVKWYHSAAEQGHVDGQFNLGVMYANGWGAARDDIEAVKWFRQAAEQGDVNAQFNLGDIYAKGLGVARDDAEAIKWFRQLAERGDAGGQFRLGEMYHHGRGVTQDETEAVKWFHKAAEQRDAGAQLSLGEMYQNGRGVARDDTEAARWFRQAAEQGNATGQFNLGNLYRNGRGVVRDDAEAVNWYRQAAEQGNANAQFHLGFMYQNGRGVAKNEAEAVKWFSRAAEQGDADAQFDLGVLYSTGRSVARDYVQAYQWFTLAAAAASETAMRDQAIKNRDATAAKMTPAQRADAVRLVREWNPVR